jgi:hypothetical protein
MRTRRLAAALVLVATAAACGGSGFHLFRQYEYEEDITLSLDGSATVNVNTSIAALDALHGTSFDTNPIAQIDPKTIAGYFDAPGTRVTRVNVSRRSNRRFVQVRMEVADVRQLSRDPAFSWSTYEFTRNDGEFAYRQVVARAAGKDVGNVGWTGGEFVRFRLHLPSKITYHNTHADIGRGNILAWEQPLADRLRGEPLTLEARMETESILYRTLFLFAFTCVAVAIAFALIIWWVRRGPRAVEV